MRLKQHAKVAKLLIKDAKTRFIRRCYDNMVPQDD